MDKPNKIGEMNPGRGGGTLLCRLLFIVLFSAALLWVVGPVMRDSDQASVLNGALQMARNGEFAGVSFYNYDRTFVSYWMLAGMLKGFGLEQGNADTIVFAGNMLACAFFLAGFAVVWLRCGPSNLCGWAVVITGLLCPTLLFSMPLLSSNMISAGWLFLLVAMMSRRTGLAGDLLSGLLAYLAVGARADAVLVMPLIAVLSIRESTWHSLFTDRRVWMVGIASLLALATGIALSSIPPFNPSAIFEPNTFAAYLVFGMGGALALLAGLVAWKLLQLIRKPSLYGCLIVISLVAPLLYYGWLMYTPRHLVTTVLMLLFTVMFDRGRQWWAEMTMVKYGRGVVLVGAGLCAVLLFVGVSMDSMKKGKLVAGATTYYPTSDGHWPMGGNLNFLLRLKNAPDDPIDHNQRVWGAWNNIDKKQVAEVPVVVRSCGLESYGALFLTVAGYESAREEGDEVSILVDGRSLFKQQAGYKLAGADGPIDWQKQKAKTVGKYTGDGIFMAGNKISAADEEWTIWQAASQVSEGDDYLIVTVDNRHATFRAPGKHRWMVIFPKGAEDMSEALSSSLTQASIDDARTDEVDSTVFVSFVAAGEQLPDIFSGLPEDAWVARSSLPAFMRRQKHGGR